MSARVETMAYAHKAGSKDAAYQVPWHGLGQPVSNDLTPKQMLKKAGLDWTVDRVPLYFKYKGKEIYAEKDGLIRSKDNRIMSHITDTWIPVQNDDAAQFFHDFVKQGHMEMNTAGSLREGELVWFLARIKKSFALRFGKKQDVVDSFLLFTLPHEYGKRLNIRQTNIRAVCQNTVNLALRQKTDFEVNIGHRKPFDPEIAKEALGLADQRFEEYKEMAEFLSKRKFNKELLGKYFDEIFPSKSKDEEKISRPARLCLESMDTQPGHELGAGSWWQAYNAVTFNIDHILGHGQDTRLQSAWYGKNRDNKLLALKKAIEFAS
jgi:phage/plasmid-like protein (TIGR03299 family)